MEEHMIETLGMRLANRTYLFNTFHIIFGAEPSIDEIRILASEETADAFSSVIDFVRREGEGSEIPGLSSEERGSVNIAFSSVEALLQTVASKTGDTEYIESLKSEFVRLFLVPGAESVSIWESPYLSQEAMLFQESTLDVRQRYREYGYEALEFGHFPEDHLSMMLDFLGQLSSRAFNAFSEGEDDVVRQILYSQQDFIERHLLNWLPDFCEALRAKDTSGVFLQFAEILHVFLIVDMTFARELLAKESLV